MDFIIQEMNRETNTIGSKANSLEITNSVIDMKTEHRTELFAVMAISIMMAAGGGGY